MNKFKVQFKDSREDIVVKAKYILINDGTLTFCGKRVGEIEVDGPFHGIAFSEIAEWEKTE